MRRYFLDIHLKSFFAEHRTTASTKPRTDAIRIARGCGFRPMVFYYWETSLSYIARRHPHFPNRLLRIQLWCFSTFVRNSVIMVQLPFLRFNMHDALRTLAKKNRIIVLAHDVEAIRETQDGALDLNTLRLADVIIVHSQPMADALVRLGIRKPCVALEFFDYLSSCGRDVRVVTDNPSLLFAGNLQKSVFLRSLANAPNLPHLNLYGGRCPDLALPPQVTYRGFFDNEDIASVEGDWGLVWDGDSVGTCAGTLGDYLRYNAPFKFSLYLALGIPVIVWSHSAMATFVQQYHLGISVGRLDEIGEKIAALPADEIARIQTGVATFSARVKSGRMLASAIEKSLSLINNP